MLRTVIIGTGCFIPDEIVSNENFIGQDFYGENNEKIETSSEVIIRKFQEITGIAERRYASIDLNTSDLAFFAAEKSILDAGIDPETLDQIIVAHNYGDILKSSIQSDAVPSIASRVKQKLGINNPSCIAYDILFGCPGWLQGVIHADAFFKAGIAKRILVIGAETLSRVLDPYDRDSMIFSDGAGATILEFQDTSASNSGLISTAAQSNCVNEVSYINFGESNFKDFDSARFIKMKGRKVYEYAMKNVPAAMKVCLENGNIDIHEVKKIFIHQANEKMDDGIIKVLYKLYGISEVPTDIMPMNIHFLGNSSVATIPTLFDTVKKGLMPEHKLNTGDVVLFASVGAGMNINAVCYRI
jgi:3-oxoacyl-[acyl-carrier-protein] synthase III